MTSSTTTAPAALTWRQIAFLTVAMPFICLLLIELICRVTHLAQHLAPQEQRLALEMPTWMFREQNTARRATRTVADEKTRAWLNLFTEGDGYRVHLIPNTKTTVTNTFSQIPQDKERPFTLVANSIGFRGQDATPQKAPQTFRIVIFGDSSSFGWGVDQNEDFAGLLPTLLSNTGKQVEVINFAIPGDSSEYGRLIAERFAKAYAPDLVIIGFGANDAKNVAVSHTVQVERFRQSQAVLQLSSLLSNSALVQTIKALIARVKGTSDQLPDKLVHAVTRARYQENLLQMAQLTHAPALLLNLCTPGDYARSARVLARQHKFEYFNAQRYLTKLLPQIVKGKFHPEIIAQMKALYPDALARNNLFYITSDGCHPNKLGHRLVAERLSQQISALIKP